jgi:hypothetical protein
VCISLQLDDSAGEVYFGIRYEAYWLLIQFCCFSFAQTCAVTQQSSSAQIRWKNRPKCSRRRIYFCISVFSAYIFFCSATAHAGLGCLTFEVSRWHAHTHTHTHTIRHTDTR